jgi:hypothetical protein
MAVFPLHYRTQIKEDEAVCRCHKCYQIHVKISQGILRQCVRFSYSHVFGVL